MADWDPVATPGILSHNDSFKEARLESGELPKYLLAKTFFDCREYDRCAAVFLPMTLPKGSIATHRESSSKGKETSELLREMALSNGYPHLSQKALFLALYAKYMSGEKRKDEESETVLGPADGGGTVNRELVGISQALESRFALHKGDYEGGQGWLEYLYGIVLAKGKNDKEARKWFIRSVNRCPHNWGAWQELGSLISSIDEVCLQAAILDLMLIYNVEATRDWAGPAAEHYDFYFQHLRKPGAFPNATCNLRQSQEAQNDIPYQFFPANPKGSAMLS